MAAFSSGLRLAAAFGSVAAKTTSFALASLAIGADRFSELVKKETIRPSNSRQKPVARVHARLIKKRTRFES